MWAQHEVTDIQKEQFSRLRNITSKLWSLDCYLEITCLQLKHSGRKGKWLMVWFTATLTDSSLTVRFVIISFHEMICAMKTKGQWPWTGTAQSAHIMKHWIMKHIIKTNILQHGTWFLGLIFREISSPRLIHRLLLHRDFTTCFGSPHLSCIHSDSTNY